MSNLIVQYNWTKVKNIIRDGSFALKILEII